MKYKKNILVFASVILACAHTAQVSAISSSMTHRVLSSSPLLYKMIDYASFQNSFEVEPIFETMFNKFHTVANLVPFAKQQLIFDQQGNGDVNPIWMNLMSNNSLANYHSVVTLSPSLTQSGALFHWYDQFEHVFIEAKTALVQCKTALEISERGGNNGLNPGILNVEQAFTQPSWNYGKIGQTNQVVGLDDIEIRIGTTYQAQSDTLSNDLIIAPFILIQAPTGTGTTAQWLFEPQVGTNHWGLGFGFESLVCSHRDLRLMLAADYRYIMPAWETRSFDLLNCGPWSRYLGLQDTYGLPTNEPVLAMPGINYFTQQAYLDGRSQMNLYLRLQKQFRNNFFEVSYNFFCAQREHISTIQNVSDTYGIYALTGSTGGAGGVTTAPYATINQNITALDPLGSPTVINAANFDKNSACAQVYATNMIAAKLEIKNNNLMYGFGANIQSALSASAISTWAVWAQFGFTFDNMIHDYHDHYDHTELYNYHPEILPTIPAQETPAPIHFEEAIPAAVSSQTQELIAPTISSNHIPEDAEEHDNEFSDDEMAWLEENVQLNIEEQEHFIDEEELAWLHEHAAANLHDEIEEPTYLLEPEEPTFTDDKEQQLQQIQNQIEIKEPTHLFEPEEPTFEQTPPIQELPIIVKTPHVPKELNTTEQEFAETINVSNFFDQDHAYKNLNLFSLEQPEKVESPTNDDVIAVPAENIQQQNDFTLSSKNPITNEQTPDELAIYENELENAYEDELFHLLNHI